MRIAKYLAHAGAASRRRAEELVKAGRITINEVVCTRLQEQIGPGDRVALDGRALKVEDKKRYLLLNKPPGYITTTADTHGRPTVLDLIGSSTERLYPVGRLDADASGVLLLTNDGELAYRLTHPRYGVEKIYAALVGDLASPQNLEDLRGGIVLDGKKTAPARVRVLRFLPRRRETLLELSLREGRKRQVKLMCSACGLPVRRLKRINFAGLGLKGLKEGESRELKAAEVTRLKKIVRLG